MRKPLTINDLKGLKKNDILNPRQRLALLNFERYRQKILSATTSDAQFQSEFQRLQSIANLSSYEEFLKEEYC